MEAKEVKNMKWIPVVDWWRLGNTHYNVMGYDLVCKADVESFVEKVFKEVAWDLNIPYTELEPILKEGNSVFYNRMERLFKRYKGVALEHEELIELKKLLRIPDVKMAPDIVNQSNVEKLLTYFSALSDREKLEFLQRLGTVSIKVEFFTK